METSDRDRIYQWLAQVPEDADPVQTDGELQVDGVNSLTTQPAARAPGPRDLEIDSIQSQHASSDQGNEHRHSQAQALQTPNHTMPTPPNPYERRPRQKTRKYRYEYKAHGSVTKDASKSHKDKKKRPMRGRKHTLNDEFHASNVARERLTVSCSLINLRYFPDHVKATRLEEPGDFQQGQGIFSNQDARRFVYCTSRQEREANLK